MPKEMSQLLGLIDRYIREDNTDEVDQVLYLFYVSYNLDKDFEIVKKEPLIKYPLVNRDTNLSATHMVTIKVSAYWLTKKLNHEMTAIANIPFCANY